MKFEPVLILSLLSLIVLPVAYGIGKFSNPAETPKPDTEISAVVHHMSEDAFSFQISSIDK